MADEGKVHIGFFGSVDGQRGTGRAAAEMRGESGCFFFSLPVCVASAGRG